MKNIFGEINKIRFSNIILAFFLDNSGMQIQIQLNRVIMKELLMQLICMEPIILMVIIMFIHFSMEYPMSQWQIHVCNHFDYCFP